MFDWVPAQLRVLRIRRPKYGCRACGSIHRAPAPDRPIAKGLATPGFIAQVLVSRYRHQHVPPTQPARVEHSIRAPWRAKIWPCRLDHMRWRKRCADQCGLH